MSINQETPVVFYPNSKVMFELQGDYPVFVVFLFLISFCCFLLFTRLGFMENQSSNRRGKKNIWEFKLLTLNCIDFNQIMLKTLSQSRRQFCVKEARKNVVIKRISWNTKYINLFITFL